METSVNKVESRFSIFANIFGTLDAYLNTAPPKDQHKTFHKSRVCVCVNSGLTSLSTIFQSYHDGVWL